MPNTNEFSVDENVLKVIATGSVDTAEELEQNTALLLKHMMSVGCSRILIDDRGLEVNMNTLAIFKAASNDAKSYKELPAEKFGVVLPQELADDAQFYQNVAHNRGFRIQFFFDETAALEWVKE